MLPGVALKERRIGEELNMLGKSLSGGGTGRGSFYHSVDAEEPRGKNKGPASEQDELIWLSDDIGLCLKQSRAAAPRTELYIGEDLFKIHFRLEGVSAIAFPGAEAKAIQGPSTALMLHPKGLEKYETVTGGAETWITLFCGPGLIADTLAIPASRLPREFSAFLDGGSPAFYARSLGLTPEMNFAVSGLLRAEYDGAMSRIFTEAKVMDLLCQVMTALTEGPAPLPQGVCLSLRDQQRLDETKDILDKSFKNPPGLAALARRVGLNQNKLASGFKHRFGITVYDYCTQRRMATALDLLLAGGCTVSEIAYSVGYEYPGNFTAAFKRYFGYAPRLAHSRN